MDKMFCTSSSMSEWISTGTIKSSEIEPDHSPAEFEWVPNLVKPEIDRMQLDHRQSADSPLYESLHELDALSEAHSDFEISEYISDTMKMSRRRRMRDSGTSPLYDMCIIDDHKGTKTSQFSELHVDVGYQAITEVQKFLVRLWSMLLCLFSCSLYVFQLCILLFSRNSYG